MIELSSILFKPVIERDTSNVVGRIKNAYFSQGCHCIAYFVISSCKQGCDALLPLDDVLCFSDAVIVQNDANVRCANDIDFTPFSSGIIGMSVYTQNGILKGQICKVEFSKSGKVQKLCTDSEQFTPQNIACVGDVILLKTAKQGKPKKPMIPRPENETTVFALKADSAQTADSAKISHSVSKPDFASNESAQISYSDQKEPVRIAENKINTAESTVAPSTSIPSNTMPSVISNTSASKIKSNAQFTPVQVTAAPMAKRPSDNSPLFSSNALKLLDAPETDDDSHTPSRIISDYSFLLGRTLSSDLLSFNGTTIAKAGTQIDDTLVDTARLYGKLVDLVLISKKPE